MAKDEEVEWRRMRRLNGEAKYIFYKKLGVLYRFDLFTAPP